MPPMIIVVPYLFDFGYLSQPAGTYNVTYFMLDRINLLQDNHFEVVIDEVAQTEEMSTQLYNIGVTDLRSAIPRQPDGKPILAYKFR